jgi:hypothetical protein
MFWTRERSLSGYVTTILVQRELFQTAQERGMENVIMDFVKEWRYLFQRTVQPQFLPSGWSLDSPVRCDSRSSSN